VESGVVLHIMALFTGGPDPLIEHRIFKGDLITALDRNHVRGRGVTLLEI
jgi:hypothetical protein